MAQLRNLRYRRNYRKAPFYWEIFGLPDDREIGMLVSLAEGEDLGSNLLRVFQSSLGSPEGRGSQREAPEASSGCLSGSFLSPRGGAARHVNCRYQPSYGPANR